MILPRGSALLHRVWMDMRSFSISLETRSFSFFHADSKTSNFSCHRWGDVKRGRRSVLRQGGGGRGQGWLGTAQQGGSHPFPKGAGVSYCSPVTEAQEGDLTLHLTAPPSPPDAEEPSSPGDRRNGPARGQAGDLGRRAGREAAHLPLNGEGEAGSTTLEYSDKAATAAER